MYIFNLLLVKLSNHQLSHCLLMLFITSKIFHIINYYSYFRRIKTIYEEKTLQFNELFMYFLSEIPRCSAFVQKLIQQKEFHL